MNPLETETAISALRSTGDFRVLRRFNLDQDTRFTGKPVEGAMIALSLDTETTGFDYVEDKIIEMGIVAFEYDPDTASIIRVIGKYNGFEDPGAPLSDEIKEITGITDEMVAGQTLNDNQINNLAQMADLVIAHNAGFDRKLVEARFPAFVQLPWACTMSQLDWKRERVSSRVLEFLLYKCTGVFFDAHRALDDAEALVGLLLGNFPVNGLPIFKELLERAGEVTSKICAPGSPFDKKDILKQRGYRWDGGEKSGCKSWWTCVPQEAEAEEMAYLASDIYPGGRTGSVIIKRIDPYSRFSVREI
jgi:DNA polymerase-3 subunit epsilon